MVDQPSLIEALRKLRPITGGALVAICGNVLLFAEDESLILTADNGDIRMTIRLPAEVRKPGKLTLPCERLCALCNQIRGEKITFSEQNSYLAEISGGGIQAKLYGLSADEFPGAIVDDQDAIGFRSNKSFAEMVERVSVAVPRTNIGKPEVQGIHIYTRNDELEMEACDGRRMHIVKTGIPVEGSISALIPSASINPIIDICKDESVSAFFKLNSATFHAGNRKLRTKLSELSFPNTSHFLEMVTPSQNTLTVPREQLLAAIGHVSVFGDGGTAKIVVRKDGLTLKSETHQQGGIESRIDCRQALECEVLLNPLYLRDAAIDVAAENVTIDVGQNFGRTPLVIRDGSFIGIVMPRTPINT